MSVSQSRLSYQDVYDVFDRALSDEHGIRIPFPSHGKAAYYRLRLNYARAIDRENNKKVFEDGHPMHGQSPYDALTATLREVDGVWYLYLVPRVDARRLEIESLEGLEQDPAETKLIEKQPETLRLTFRR